MAQYSNENGGLTVEIKNLTQGDLEAYEREFMPLYEKEVKNIERQTNLNYIANGLLVRWFMERGWLRLIEGFDSDKAEEMRPGVVSWVAMQILRAVGEATAIPL